MSSILTRAHTGLLYFGGFYALFLAALTLEPVQRSLIYLHQARYPLNPNFLEPERYGFAPGKVLPLTLTTPDNETLGAWLVLPNDVYEEYISIHGMQLDGPLPQSVFDNALSSHNSIVYHHGNAASRAAPNRLRVARLMSAENVNFLIYDYRGFADSTGKPSEEGLLIDARTAWNYLNLEKKVSSDKISIMGQSLGTGVSVSLTASLATENIIPRSVILVAPFTSIPHLLEDFKLFSFIPILSPFKTIPGAIKLFLNVLVTQFDSKSIIDKIRCPLLILHALNDSTIPFSHSEELFKHLVTSSTSSKPETTKAGNWGIIRSFEREGKGRVVYGEALVGGHNEIGSGEQSIRLIRNIIA